MLARIGADDLHFNSPDCMAVTDLPSGGPGHRQRVDRVSRYGQPIGELVGGHGLANEVADLAERLGQRCCLDGSLLDRVDPHVRGVDLLCKPAGRWSTCRR